MSRALAGLIYGMFTYFGRKLPAIVLTIFGVVTFVFLMIRLVPGDPASVILGDYATEKSLAQLRQDLGLNEPLIVQYVIFVRKVLGGDLGQSLVTKRPVVTEIAAVLPHTVVLTFAGILVSVVIAIPIGIVAALRRNTLVDYITMSIAVLGTSVPVFWLAMVLVLIFSLNLGLFPSIGAGDEGNLPSQLRHLVLPAVSLGLRQAGLIARLTRATMLEVLCEDYIQTARGKGLHERVVLVRHALRNALTPVVTIIGLQVGVYFAGSVLIETVFARPGIGTVLLTAIFNRDYPLVQGIILVFGTSFLMINLLVDLTCAMIDPRVRLRSA